VNPNATRRAIYGKMAGDTTLNNLLATPASGFSKAIYHQTAPAGATHPFVIFSKQSGVPTYALVTTPAFETDVWMVKAVDKDTSATDAEAISTRLNALLTDGVLSISGATQLYLRRQSDIDYEEDDDGVTFRHVGSLYRLLFQ
jgi:Protein of unknown function (DUF3168)